VRPSGPDSATLLFGGRELLAFVDVLVGGSLSEALESILETRGGPGLLSLDVGRSKSDEILWLSSSSPFFFLLAASFLNYRVTSVSMFPIREVPQEVVLRGNQPCLGKDGPDRDPGIDGAIFGRRNQVL
jgi:hypothetical protein